MPRPRTPGAVADLTGASRKNPQRFRGRSEPKSGALGDPPDWMTCEHEIAAWETFKREMPWLAQSDRTLVEISARLRGRLIKDPDMGVNALAQLRLCVQEMGGSPASRSKVCSKNEEHEDPDDKFYN